MQRTGPELDGDASKEMEQEIRSLNKQISYICHWALERAIHFPTTEGCLILISNFRNYEHRCTFEILLIGVSDSPPGVCWSETHTSSSSMYG